MHILVLGAGVVGTTTAYYLAEDGHQVTVVDRQPAAGLETSFANGAQISACHVKPWAVPGMPWQSLKWMFQADAPLLFKPWRWDPALWEWGLRFLANCTDARARDNMNKALRVALYSRDMLKALRQRTNIQYDQVLQGILHIYRTEAEFALGRGTADKLSAIGLPQAVLTPAECLAIEPALRHSPSLQLAGGLMSPDDESGDALVFSQELAKLAAARGAQFHFGRTVTRLEAAGRTVTRVVTDGGDYTPDAVVLSLGSFSPLLARDLGMKLPIYPAKGYSITVEIDNPDAAPTVSVTDETRYMVFSRLGNKMRVAGTVEMGGWNNELIPSRVEPLLRNAKATFPAASAYTNVEAWAGLRPATPDSVPIIGGTPYGNLFLNTGHGMLGWTMACGSGRALADVIAGRTPEMDMTGLGLDRF